MDYELIWWLIVGGVVLFFMIGAMFSNPIDDIDITWGKERDWARREREGKL